MQGEDHIPPTYKAYSDTLRRWNPEMTYRVWDDASLRRVCYSLHPRYGTAYDRCRYMHQRVDFGRYCVVLAYGGITIDMDVKPLKPLTHVIEMIPPSSLGVSQFPLSTVESSIFAMRQQTWWLNNATLIAHQARLPACRRLVDRIAMRLLGTWWRWMPHSMAVLYTTGPMAFMEAFIHHIPHHEWTMLPHAYFEPCSGFDPTCAPSADSVVNHVHDATWQSGWYSWSIRQFYRVKRHPVLSTLVSLASVVLVVMRLARRT